MKLECYTYHRIIEGQSVIAWDALWKDALWKEAWSSPVLNTSFPYHGHGRESEYLTTCTRLRYPVELYYCLLRGGTITEIQGSVYFAWYLLKKNKEDLVTYNECISYPCWCDLITMLKRGNEWKVSGNKQEANLVRITWSLKSKSQEGFDLWAHL